MAGHPNSLANLKPPWQPGVQPQPGQRYVERMLARANKAAPQAIRLLAQAMRNPEIPMGLRLRCAEFIVDKTWPKDAAAGLLGALGGVEWLELRFVAPGGAQNAPETHRLELEPATDVEPEDDPTP